MRRKSLSLFLLVTFAWTVFPMAAAMAYEGGAVSDGGSISGVVKFKGKAPDPKKLMISKDKKVCDKTPKTDPSLIVSDGNLVRISPHLPWLRLPISARERRWSP